MTHFIDWEDPQWALITGASSGIGAEFARQLASKGFNLVLLARRKEKLKELSEELAQAHGIETELVSLDLADLRATMKYAEKLGARNDIDVLINNAGFGVLNTFVKIDPQVHVNTINVHITAPVLFCRMLAPQMMNRKRGVIINLGSFYVLEKNGTSVMYTMTKTALVSFSELLQLRVKGAGIKVQALCPGYVYTEFHDTELMSGFQRKWFKKFQWMEASDVVEHSLSALKTDDLIVIPGDENLKHVMSIREKSVEKYLKCKQL